MKYYAPFGSSDPNASYVNGDPLNGVMGSIPDCRGFEEVMREVANAVAAGGITPADDVTQLAQLLQSGVMTYTVDQSTAANSLILAPLFAYQKILPGTVFRFKATFGVTGDTVAQINALAGLGVRKSAGAKLSGGEWYAGDMVTLEYDGSYLQLKGSSGGSGLLVATTLTLNVPSALYPTIQSAVLAAGQKLIAPNVYVNIAVAAGYTEYLTASTGPIKLTHPFGQRCKIIGAPLIGALPTYNDLAGKSNAQVLALYQSRFACRINCVGTGAFELHSGAWNLISNFLIDGDGTASGGFYGFKVGDWATEVGMGSMGLLNVAVHNFGLDNIRAEQSSVIQAVNVISTYSAAHGFHISHYSVLECNTGNLLVMYCQVGIMLQNCGQLAVDSSSGIVVIAYSTMQGIGSPDYGVVNAYSCTSFSLLNNGTYGINMALFSVVALPSNGGTTFQGNAQGDVYASYYTTVVTYGCALPKGSSPGRGAGVGNVGASVV